ncbi:glycosyltransferase [Prosthecobacter sp.]
MKKPRIILLSDHAKGGASLVPNLLASSLAEHQDFEIQRWHFDPPLKSGTFPATVRELSFATGQKRPALERIIKNVSKRFASLIRCRRHERALFRAVASDKPDLIHLHNIHSADLNHATLIKLPPSIPLIWTMHDFWPLKATAFRWTEMETGKHELYEVGPWPRKTLLKMRDELFASRRNITLVAPSECVRTMTRHYTARNHLSCDIIPYVVRQEFFSPPDRAAARKQWNLDPELLWIGVGSTWNNSRKGLDVLWRALAEINCRGIGLLIWGEMPAVPTQFPGLQLSHVGAINDPSAVASLYAAVDVFVCPTKADTGPLTVIESMACSTPTIASSVGGIPERVKHGINGLLFPSQDYRALAKLLKEVHCGIWNLVELGRHARQYANENCTPNHQLQKYTQLYHRILNM